MAPRSMTRRVWLSEGLRLCGAAGTAAIASASLWAGAMAIGAGGCASRAILVRPGPNRRVTVRVEEHPELAALGGSLKLRTEDAGKLIYLVRAPDGGFVAINPTCTHAGCTVRPQARTFDCPCHGSSYDLRGNVLRGPAMLPLTTYPTEELSPGLVEIALP